MNKLVLVSLLLIGMGGSKVWAQSHELRGTVGSDEGTGGFTGATVVVKGTTIGTVTDVDGPFG